MTIVDQWLIIVKRPDMCVCGAQKHVDFARVRLVYLLWIKCNNNILGSGQKLFLLKLHHCWSDEPSDICSNMPDPCKNNGTCIGKTADVGRWAECKCQGGYFGFRCEYKGSYLNRNNILRLYSNFVICIWHIYCIELIFFIKMS